MKIFVPNGKAGSGKDVFAECVKDYYKVNVHSLSFAGSLREELLEAFSGLTLEMTNDRTLKEQPSEKLTLSVCKDQGFVDFCKKEYGLKDDEPLSPRMIMQAWGTMKRDVVDENYWVNRVLDKITDIFNKEPSSVIIITDCRYENEMKQLHKLSINSGGKIDLEQISIIRNAVNKNVGLSSHSSEDSSWLEPFIKEHNMPTRVIANNDTLEAYKEKIHDFLVDVSKPKQKNNVTRACRI